MRFPSPFESSIWAFSSYKTKIDNMKTKMRIIREANAYSTMHNNTLYYLQNKKKNIYIYIYDERNKLTKASRHEA
jgi:hypothetical protein